ncbi:MAG: UDP-galactopyranose mutase [Elusimicrobiota bacterium]
MPFDMQGRKCLVVGAGFFGATIAERIAQDADAPVLVIDQRDHIGGNCYSERDQQTGIEFHKYGTHIFHTEDRTVWDYISRFTAFNGYRHQVLTTHKNKVYQMPINLETINSFYGKTLKPFEVKAFLADEIAREGIAEPRNLEEMAISLVGRPLYEAFIKGYTEKQWEKDPVDLPAAIIERLPFRHDYAENYYFDRWQGIPLDGYTRIFERLLEHKNIEVRLGVDFFAVRKDLSDDCLVVYTGPLDRYFDYQFGRLESRTLRFEKEVVAVGDFQGTSVMNYADRDIPYTRIHEPRHLHLERDYPRGKSLIFREFPQLGTAESPFYPINTPKNNECAARYKKEREKHPNVVFGGRLADYEYCDMDRTIAKALETYRTQIKPRLK